MIIIGPAWCSQPGLGSGISIIVLKFHALRCDLLVKIINYAGRHRARAHSGIFFLAPLRASTTVYMIIAH